MRIPDHVIQQVKESMDILDIVQDYYGLTLKKRGSNHWCLSPFSNEKTPSFAVNPAKGIFKDFGASGKGGNAITFLMEAEGYSYPETIRLLAKRYGISIPEVEVAPDSNEVLYDISRKTAKIYHRMLMQNPDALNYLMIERDISIDMIEKYQIGYAGDLSTLIANDPDTLDNLFRIGVLGQSEYTGKYYQRFKGRITFPIRDILGRFVAFSCRIWGDMDSKNTGKYINSPESPIYTKGNHLYGLYEAKRDIRSSKTVVLMEGNTDKIGFDQAGISFGVGNLGTELTDNQARLIASIADRVVLLYDNGEAGWKASIKAQDKLLPYGIEVLVMNIPPEFGDPDDWRRDGDIQAGLNKCLPWYDRLIALVSYFQDHPKDKANTIRSIVQSIDKMPDKFLKLETLRTMSDRLGYSVGDLSSYLSVAPQKAIQQPTDNPYAAFMRYALQFPVETAETLFDGGEKELDIEHELNDIWVMIREGEPVVEIVNQFPDLAAGLIMDTVEWDPDTVYRKWLIMVLHDLGTKSNRLHDEISSQPDNTVLHQKAALIANFKMRIEKQLYEAGQKTRTHSAIHSTA